MSSAARSAGSSARLAASTRRCSCRSRSPSSASHAGAVSTRRRYGSRPSPAAKTASNGSRSSSGWAAALTAARYGRFATITSRGPGTGHRRSPRQTTTRPSSRRRLTFARARATARRLGSVAHTSAPGQTDAIATAIAPEPVPTSAMRARRPPTRAAAAATSCSLAGRGVITFPGALNSLRPLKPTCVTSRRCRGDEGSYAARRQALGYLAVKRRRLGAARRPPWHETQARASARAGGARARPARPPHARARRRRDQR